MAFTDHVKFLFGADTTDLNKELADAGQKVEGFGKKYTKYIAGALGTAVLVKTTKDVITFAAEIDNLSSRLGTTTDFLQGLQYGAEQSGVSAGAAAIAFQRFTRRTQEAKEKGTGPLAETLEKLDIKFKNTNGIAKTSAELFEEFGQKLSQMENPAEKVKTAFQFLDTEGVGLTQMFKEGGKTIEEFTDEARQLGILMDASTITTLREADDTLAKLGRQFKVTVAQFLPPFLDKLQAVGVALSKGMKFVKDYSGSITALVVAIGTFKAASVAFTVVAPIIRGLSMMKGGVDALKTSIVAMNVASKANLIGLIATAALAAVAGVKALADWLDRGRAEMERYVEVTKQKAQKAIKQFNETIAEATEEIRVLNQELGELEKAKAPKLELDEEIKNLEQIIVEQKKILKNSKERADDFARFAKSVGDKIDKEKQGEAYVAKQLKLKAEYEATSVTATRDYLAAKKKILEAEKKLAPKLLEQKDIEFARANGLLDLLKSRSKEQEELDQIIERVKALKEGGEEQLKLVQTRHEQEKLVKELMEKQKMPMDQALALAKNLVRARADEKKLQAGIKAAEDEKKEAAKKTKDEQEKINDKLREQQRLQALARGEADQQLAVLRLMAQGRDKEAQQLQDKLDFEKDIKRIMDQQGLVANAAMNQLNDRVELENQIKIKKIDQKIEEEKKALVEKLAAKDRRDAVDRLERKRIQAAQKVERLEKQINQAIEDGGQNAAERVEKLEELKQDAFKVILTDETAEGIKELQKEKLDIQDNHAAQLQALQQAAAAVDKQQQAAAAEAAQQNADIRAAGAQQQEEVAKVIDAGEEAIEDVGEATVKAIEDIADPVVNVKVDNSELKVITQAINNLAGKLSASSGSPASPPPSNPTPPIPPIINNNISVVIESELKEQTQINILETLKGYFVNQ